MHFEQPIPQNFLYASKATEFGRGTKTKWVKEKFKSDGSPDHDYDTPGPGQYEPPSDFQKQLLHTRAVVVSDVGEAEETETVIPWNQKGYK